MIRFLLAFVTWTIPFWTLGQDSSPRYYSYSCLSLAGNSVRHSNFYCRSTIGQFSPIAAVTHEQFMVRQGFQQPLFVFSNLATKPQTITRLLLYPNPSSGRINLFVELESKDGFQYRILDTGGRLISSGYGESDILLEMDDLVNKASGLYFLMISTPMGDYLTTQRIMVQ